MVRQLFVILMLTVTAIAAVACAGSSAGNHGGDYAFDVGGGYVAEFGGSEGVTGKVVFQDAFSGLVITRTTRKSGLVLARAHAQDGERAFVVFPDARVVSVYLRMTPSVVLRIDGLAEQASGLPVMNANGHVVGLTQVIDGEVRLFGADVLRRYMRTFNPALAGGEPIASTAGELAERISASAPR